MTTNFEPNIFTRTFHFLANWKYMTNKGSFFFLQVKKSLISVDRNVYVIFISILFFSFGYGLIVYNFPLFAKELNATSVQVGYIYSAGTLSAAISAIIGGFLTRKYELRRFIFVTFLFAIPSVLFYMRATNWVHLLIGMILAGASYMEAPATSFYVHLKSKKGSEGLNFGIISAAFPLGLVVMPGVGGLIADHYGLRTVFAGTLIFYLISLLTFLFLDKQEPAENHESSFSEIFYALVKERRFLKTMVIFSILITIHMILEPFMPIFLRKEIGLNYSKVGFTAMVIFAVNALATPLIGRFADQYGVGKILSITLLGYGAGLILMANAKSYYFIILIALMLGVFGHVYTLSSVATARNVGELHGGVAYGILHFSRTAISMMGPVIGGHLDEISHSLPVFVPGILFVFLSGSLFVYQRIVKKGKLLDNI